LVREKCTKELKGAGRASIREATEEKQNTLFANGDTEVGSRVETVLPQVVKESLVFDSHQR
jgi:hypothetical protein